MVYTDLVPFYNSSEHVLADELFDALGLGEYELPIADEENAGKLFIDRGESKKMEREENAVWSYARVGAHLGIDPGLTVYRGGDTGLKGQGRNRKYYLAFSLQDAQKIWIERMKEK